jgi:hypothetical protein
MGYSCDDVLLKITKYDEKRVKDRRPDDKDTA